MSLIDKGFTFGYKSYITSLETDRSNNWPGPGSYNLNESYETLHKLPDKTFGKEKRFIKEDLKQNTSLAPGIYNTYKNPRQNLPNITFTNSKRYVEKNTIGSNIGPGSYDVQKYWSSKNNALPFTQTENKELILIFRKDTTPGPGKYDWEKFENQGGTLVNYSNKTSKKKLKTLESEFNPGPGEYDLAKYAQRKSISFSKAEKSKIEINNPNVSPTTYEIKPSIYDFLGNNKAQICHSFPHSKRMHSLHLEPMKLFIEKTDDIHVYHEKNIKGITFFKAKRNAIESQNEKKNVPGPGQYETVNSLNNLQSIPDAKKKMQQIIEKLKIKSFFGKSGNVKKQSISKDKGRRKILKNNRLKPIISILTQNTDPAKKNDEINALKKKHLINNPLKSYILKKIEKNVEKKLEHKINKEIFILSNNAENQRKNKGFTTSSRKYEFLHFNLKIPGPEKYEIKRELNSMTLPFRKSRKFTIFDIDNDVRSSNSYNIQAPLFKTKEKNKDLKKTLKKNEEINNRKKLVSKK